MGINPFYMSSNNIALTFMHQRSVHTAAVTTEVVSPVPSSNAPGLVSPSHVHHGGSEAGVSTVEYRRTAELGYQMHFGDEMLVTALMPFSSVTVESQSRLTVMGNGDLTLYGQYILRGEPGGRFTALLGGGVQFPTGRTDARDDNGTLLDYRLQPGNGSVGFILATTGFYQNESWTIALDLFGKLNRKNSAENRMGHALAVGLVGSYELYRDNPSLFAIIGSVGFRSEASSQDVLDGIADGRSGSTVHYLNCGVQFAYDVLRFDLRSLIPLYQRRPEGGADENARLVAGMRVMM